MAHITSFYMPVPTVVPSKTEYFL